MHDPYADALSFARLMIAILAAFAFVVFCSATSPRVRLGAVAVLLAALAFVASALAAPPTSGELQWSDWYRSLRVPDADGQPTPESCCDLSDCRPIEQTRVTREGYEALITPKTHSQFGIAEPTWVKVPHTTILQTTRNPDGTGRAVICWMPSRGTICFVRPLEI